MAEYSIKDLERLSGIKAHTIRIWEKRYGLLKPSRTDTNIRHYSDADLKHILNVSILNRHGIKISHIASMDESEMTDKIVIISRDVSDYESLIENLVISMVDLNQEKFEKLLSRSIMQIGFEDSILKIVYPFLEKIGILWQTGTINPAQEHFITHLVRQKIIVGIDSVIPASHPSPKHFLLFLPEGELHELGLLFYSYILQKRGHKVTYLGQWVPLADMASASTVLNVDFLLTSIAASHSGTDLMDYLVKLSATFHNKTIYISGYQVSQISGTLPGNIIRFRTAVDLLSCIQ
ncbi:MAG: MerR family transcriptional regulator [Bacteroides sp. SM23_62]|nr:MAG: MerR family transcriptional regulator [Bacteroides sp. SM23_62]